MRITEGAYVFITVSVGKVREASKEKFAGGGMTYTDEELLEANWFAIDWLNLPKLSHRS